MIFVALLRGINVGGNNKISMAELVQVFVGLGFSNVKSYINSGNIIFELKEKLGDKKISNQIEDAIQKKFKLNIIVQIRNQQEIARIARQIPANIKNDTDTKGDVLFLSSEIDSPKIVSELGPKECIDNLIYTPGAVIWYLEKKNYNKGSMNKLIGTKLYANMTVRNVNTVRKLDGLINT